MVCKNCGAALPDTAAFCFNCGAAAQPPAREPAPQQERQPQYQPPQPNPQPQYQAAQPQYQAPQYAPPAAQPPRQKKSGAAPAVLAAVLGVLLIAAVIWGVSLSKKLKAKDSGAQGDVTVSQQAEDKKKPSAPAQTETPETDAPETETPETEATAAGAAATEKPVSGNGPSLPEENPVAPNAGEMIGKLEGFWTASDGSAFIHFASEQFGWAVSVGYYYSDLEVYAHMTGELHRNQAGYYNAHFSEHATGRFPAFDFDMWIDAFDIDSGKIRCVMVEEGRPDYDNMPVLTFSGYTMEEAAPSLN